MWQNGLWIVWSFTCRLDVRRYFALWSLPPSPFPPAFPTLYPSPPGTPACMQPRSLSFVLGGDHPASHSGVYSLFVVACSGMSLITACLDTYLCTVNLFVVTRLFVVACSGMIHY